MPSLRPERLAVLELLEKTPEQQIYELGSGWGGLARCVAKRFHDKEVIAVEKAMLPFLYSKMVQKLRPLPNLQLIRGDLFEQPLSKESIALTYLFPKAMRRLAKSGSKSSLISIAFALPKRKAQTVITCQNLWKTKIYYYAHEDLIDVRFA